MPRPLPVAALFAAAALALTAAGVPGQQPDAKKGDKNTFAPPPVTRPDEATLKTIADKTAQLREAVAALKAKAIPGDVWIEVEVYLRAAENIVRFDEWLHKDSGKWALTTLDRGLERAKQAEDGKAPWRDEVGRWVVRAYRSQVDGSIQPYAVLYPAEDTPDPSKQWRLDVVLHGRDGALTEAKFLAQHDKTRLAPKGLGHVQLEVYGRGNNAYRWAGETDVYEAQNAFILSQQLRHRQVDRKWVVLRGFSMGGAGTWHIGLHHPSRFSAIGPGAGFTNTHGYIAKLPDPLPDHQEKCLRIYDAYRYAENAFNVPVVAYSGEKDAQKKAADNIEAALKGFPEKLRFTHLVAPGLEHQQPPEWQAKCEEEYRKYAETPRATPTHIRLVTYTPTYGECDWVSIDRLQTTYEKAVVDIRLVGNTYTGTTTNVRELTLDRRLGGPRMFKLVLDGQEVEPDENLENSFVRINGRWVVRWSEVAPALAKRRNRTGPIDDAFRNRFEVTAPSAPGWHAATDRHARAADAGFAKLWDRYFRGALPRPGVHVGDGAKNAVLFGDPQSNPKIAEVLPTLPITWTKEKLVVNGVSYDPATHLPVLIYPKFTKGWYVVINSGHTFGEADLKGTNALLYPRLGDWAVVRPTPTDRDPAAHEVVAAGLFDENWQFPKK